MSNNVPRNAAWALANAAMLELGRNDVHIQNASGDPSDIVYRYRERIRIIKRIDLIQSKYPELGAYFADPRGAIEHCHRIIARNEAILAK